MLPTATPVTKRVVVHIVKGRLSGVRKIVGHIVLDGDEQFPPSIDMVNLGDHSGRVIHAGTMPRYILYREWIKPVTQTYGQQLKETFDPRQA